MNSYTSTSIALKYAPPKNWKYIEEEILMKLLYMDKSNTQKISNVRNFD